MAYNAYIKFTFNGSEIEGQSTVSEMASINLSNHVEAVAFYQELTMSTDVSSGLSTGRLQAHPLTFVKVPDRTTPMFLHALANSHAVNATIRMFSNTRQGSIQLQQTITTTDGRITAVRSEILNTTFSDSASVPMLERISFSYRTLQTVNETDQTESVINLSTLG